MQELRFGIVGMGIGRSQGRAIAADPRGRVSALCDLDESRMREFAAELPEPVKLFTRYEAMVADPDVDAVFVGTPNQLHVPVAMAAVRAGKHVLCTKPLSDSEGAARELVKLVESAEHSGGVNMMSLSMRFGGVVQHLGQYARAGELGEIYYARARSVRRSGIPGWGAHFIHVGGGASTYWMPPGGWPAARNRWPRSAPPARASARAVWATGSGARLRPSSRRSTRATTTAWG
jgi:predicted dehydrogenase